MKTYNKSAALKFWTNKKQKNGNTKHRKSRS